ncbi:MAG: hypothetical protein QM497_09985 [Sulfurimonas sp.]
MLLSLFFLKPFYFNQNEDDALIWPIKLFVLWNIISIARGLFVAENYWEWKHLLVNGFVMLIPLFVYILSSKSFSQKILLFWTKYILFSIIFFIPIAKNPSFYGLYLNPIMLLLILFPLLPTRWKFLVLFLVPISILASTGSRSLVIYYSLSTVLGLSYYFKAFLNNFIFKLVHSTLMLLPFVLLILGLSGIFNIFKMDQYIKGNYSAVSNETGEAKETSLKADTRTFLYVENIGSALKHDYVIQGRTPANGYDSKYFGNFMKYALHTGKQQRFTSEVGILNVFLWGGLIGVVLYFLIFLYASFLAVYKSNSYFMKIIGIFVAFRWAYSFVGEFSTFNTLNILLWLFISMSYSTEFRKMNDEEFKEWTKGILPNFVYSKRINRKN